MTTKVTNVLIGCTSIVAIALLSGGAAQANLVENGG